MILSIDCCTVTTGMCISMMSCSCCLLLVQSYNIYLSGSTPNLYNRCWSSISWILANEYTTSIVNCDDVSHSIVNWLIVLATGSVSAWCHVQVVYCPIIIQYLFESIESVESSHEHWASKQSKYLKPSQITKPWCPKPKTKTNPFPPPSTGIQSRNVERYYANER